jgi:circadian clock protein KaiC
MMADEREMPPVVQASHVHPPVASSGIPGLDVVLSGGFTREEMHMVQGVAGTGKTTLALTFLATGAQEGEQALYLTLSQSRAHLERIANSHGWNLAGVTIHELAPSTIADRLSNEQTVLATTDVELQEVFRDILATIHRVKPRRAVVDSITILQILSGPQRYHREVVTLRQLFVENQCTVLFLADHPAEMEQGSEPEVQFHPLSGCVLHLEQVPRSYGDAQRKLRVVKSRGLASATGYHDVKIRTGRMEVYPRLAAYSQPERSEFPVLASGIENLDKMLHGGLEYGAACLMVGPPGTGKSTLASVFAAAAANAGKHVAIFLFDERPETYKARAEGAKIGLRPHIESGRVVIRQLDPSEIAPGEFAQQVKQTLDENETSVVAIDSMAGYFNAVGRSDIFVAQLHELLTFLSRRGVLTILAASQVGFMSVGEQHGVDISYLSDTILVLGYYEEAGNLRRYVCAVKKRQGTHGTEVRELHISSEGVHVTEPIGKAGPIVLRGYDSPGGRPGQ